MNVARGILISLVVIGHIEIPTNISRFIYLFHIAALFFISGYFSTVDVTSWRTSCVSCLKRVGKLYLYYLTYEVLFLLFKNLFFKLGFYAEGVVYGGKMIHPDTWCDLAINFALIVIGMGREVMASAFWYFISLIFTIVIFTSIRFVVVRQSLIKPERLELLLIFFVFSLGCVCNHWNIYLPRIAPACTLILPFYWGYLQAEGRMNLKFNNLIVLLLSFIGLVILSNYGSISMNANMFPNPLFFVLATFCGIYMTIATSKLIEVHCGFITDVFRYIGKSSVAVMIFHIFSFKMVFLLQYLMGEIPYSAVSQLLGNPNGSILWFLLFLLSGIYFSIFLFRGVEKLLSVLGTQIKNVLR